MCSLIFCLRSKRGLIGFLMLSIEKSFVLLRIDRFVVGSKIVRTRLRERRLEGVKRGAEISAWPIFPGRMAPDLQFPVAETEQLAPTPATCGASGASADNGVFEMALSLLL